MIKLMVMVNVARWVYLMSFSRLLQGFFGKHISLRLCARHEADAVADLTGFIVVNQSK